MPRTKNERSLGQSPARTSKAGAGIAGAGGGTLLAVIATQLDDSNSLKPWLIYATPSASIALGGMWIWLQVKAINFVRDRETRKIINETMHAIKQALSNPNTSSEHKEILQRRLEQFEMASIDRAMKKLRGNPVISFDDIRQRE